MLDVRVIVLFIACFALEEVLELDFGPVRAKLSLVLIVVAECHVGVLRLRDQSLGIGCLLVPFGGCEV